MTHSDAKTCRHRAAPANKTASQQNCSQINRNKANCIVAAAVAPAAHAAPAACWLILIYGQLKLESNFLAINKTSSKEIVFVCLRRVQAGQAKTE